MWLLYLQCVDKVHPSLINTITLSVPSHIRNLKFGGGEEGKGKEGSGKQNSLARIDTQNQGVGKIKGQGPDVKT